MKFTGLQGINLYFYFPSQIVGIAGYRRRTIIMSRRTHICLRKLDLKARSQIQAKMLLSQCNAYFRIELYYELHQYPCYGKTKMWDWILFLLFATSWGSSLRAFRPSVLEWLRSARMYLGIASTERTREKIDLILKSLIADSTSARTLHQLPIHTDLTVFGDKLLYLETLKMMILLLELTNDKYKY